MKNVFITTAAAALLLASQSAMAQREREGQGPNPGAGPSAPANPGTGPGEGARPAPAQRAPNAAPHPQPGPATAPHAEQPQRPPQQRAEPKAPVQPQQKQSESKQPTQPRAETKGKEVDTNRTARDGNAGKSDANKPDAKRDSAQGKDNPNAASNNRDQADAKDKGHSDRMAGTQDVRQARERLEAKDRARLHDSFDRRAAKVNVRVNVRVGGNVPRNIRLVRVPTTVISFFPYYRDYSYFVEDDTVYIVNPRTYEVVDMIDDNYVRAQPMQQARLSLSPSQMGLIRESISSDIPVERINLRLALGAEIPANVELQRFPTRVVDNVRDLERYRFVLIEDQIVVVDPNDRSIALVIDRT